MTDMGGTHGWLRDAGGGTERSMRPSIPIVPTDEQLADAIGATIQIRYLISNSVERITWMGSSGTVETAILKSGGFLRDPREWLLYRELLRPGDGAPTLIQMIAATSKGSHTSNDHSESRTVETRASEQTPETDWLILEDVHGRMADLTDPVEMASVYRQLACIHLNHRVLPQRRHDADTTTHCGVEDTRASDISAELVEHLSAQPLTLRTSEEGHLRMDTLATLVDRAVGDREIWEFSVGARNSFATVQKWAVSGLDRLLASGPVGLLHGDFQRNNWLLESAAHNASGVDTDPARSAIIRVRILDWESAAFGPGIIDLFYLSPDTAGAGHAPAGELTTLAINAYMAESDPSSVSHANQSGARRILRDAIIWGAIASTITRLADYFSELPMTRTPRGELPGAALDLLEYAASYADRGARATEPR